MPSISQTLFARRFYNRPIVALAGDSRVAQGLQIQNAGTVNQAVNRFAQGLGSWVEFLSGGAVSAPIAHNVAISGAGSDSLLNVQVPQLLALSPRPTHVVIQTITNDATAVSLATQKANLSAVITLLLEGGVVPVFLTDAPRTLATWTTAARNVSYNMNRWLETVARNLGAVVIDTRPVLVDPANANGDPLSGYVQVDGIHPTYLTAFETGKLIVAYFQSIGLSNPTRRASQAEPYDATNNPNGNFFPSGGLFVGSGGTNTGTGASGTVPSGWNNRVVSGTGTSVSSLVARADGGPGNWWSVDVACSADMVVRLSPTTTIVPSEGYSAGDLIEMSGDVAVVGATGLRYVQMLLQDYDGTTIYRQSIDFKGAQIGAQWYNMPAAFAGRLHTDPIPINAASTQLVTRVEIGLAAGGSATVRLGAMDLSKPIT